MTHMISKIEPIRTTSPNLKHNPREGIPFKLNDIFRGTVVGYLSSGRVLIASSGKQFPARTPLDLAVGEKYQFQVRSLTPHIELKVLDGGLREASPFQLWALNRLDRRRFVEILKGLGSARMANGISPQSMEHLRRFTHHFPALFYDQSDEHSTRWVRRVLGASGLFWEHKVADNLMGGREISRQQLLSGDLKGMLLALSRSLKAEEPSNSHVHSLLLVLDEALSIIERDQLMNVASMRDNVGWFWFVPGLSDNGFHQAEVYVEEMNGDEMIRLFLLLEWSHLGQVEAVLSIEGKRISVELFTPNKKISEFLSSHLSILEKGLVAIGFIPITLRSEVNEKEAPHHLPFRNGTGTSSRIDLIL